MELSWLSTEVHVIYPITLTDFDKEIQKIVSKRSNYVNGSGQC